MRIPELLKILQLSVKIFSWILFLLLWYFRFFDTSASPLLISFLRWAQIEDDGIRRFVIFIIGSNDIIEAYSQSAIISLAVGGESEKEDDGEEL